MIAPHGRDPRRHRELGRPRAVLPAGAGEGARQREKLTYYARFFPVVEVDTTFYGIPRLSTVEGWLQRTPADFRFNVKAYRSLTGHEREGGRPRAPTPEEERDFMAAIAPLREAGRLVAVHYQFPPWFKNSPQARDAIAVARERHPEDIVAIEFRHRSWFDDGAWPATADLLRELDAVYVGVDAPQIGDATAPPLLEVTSPRLAIARFHGRNRGTWYIRDPPPAAGTGSTTSTAPPSSASGPGDPGGGGFGRRPRRHEQQSLQLRRGQRLRARGAARRGAAAAASAGPRDPPGAGRPPPRVGRERRRRPGGATRQLDLGV